MNSSSIDCLNNTKSQNLKKTLLHPDNELFAFHWSELPKPIENKVVKFINSRYGYDVTNDEIKHIFKCSVARDIDIKLPYIKVETTKIPAKKHRKLVFNETTFDWNYVDQDGCPEETQTKLYLYVYAPSCKNRADFHDDEGYVRLGINTNCIADTFDGDIGEYDNSQMAIVEAECIDKAREDIFEYIRGSMSCAKFAALVDEINNDLYKLDWTKKNVFHFKKSYFMQFPPNFENDYEWDNDDELLETIKKYKLQSDVCQEFIDWLAGNCEKPILTGPNIKLTTSTAHLFKNSIDWGWLGRGNIVDNYHGIPDYNIQELEVGTKFTTKSSKNTINTYIVVCVGHDGDLKLVAYAKEGSLMNSQGFMDLNDVYLGIDADIIEESWDALFPVNRQGRRKKILKNFAIVV